MESSLFSTKDIIKYLIVAGLIYTILKMIPSQQISVKDLVLVMVIIIIGFVSVDCLFLKKSEGFANEQTNNSSIESLLQKPLEETNNLSVADVLIEQPSVNPKVACSLEVEKLKKQLQDEINAHINEKKSLEQNSGNLKDVKKLPRN